MGFSKADIERARKRNALKIAQGQLGGHIKSLDQVEVVKKIKKSDGNLGKVLNKLNIQKSERMKLMYGEKY